MTCASCGQENRAAAKFCDGCGAALTDCELARASGEAEACGGRAVRRLRRDETNAATCLARRFNALDGDGVLRGMSTSREPYYNALTRGGASRAGTGPGPRAGI